MASVFSASVASRRSFLRPGGMAASLPLLGEGHFAMAALRGVIQSAASHGIAAARPRARR